MLSSQDTVLSSLLFIECIDPGLSKEEKERAEEDEEKAAKKYGDETSTQGS